MSGIRHQKSERGKPHYARAPRALYPTSDLRSLIFAERGRESFRGFTLLELLIVIGIIAILLVLIAPAFTTIKSGTEVTTAIYGVKGLLENARAYAKANHTYIFVGFAEVDSSVDPSVSPQITTGDTPYGRVAVAVVASKDGTSLYQYATSDQGNDWAASYANGTHLVAVGKLQTYENLHFVPVDFGSWSPTRSEERRVGKEGRSRWWAVHERKKYRRWTRNRE